MGQTKSLAIVDTLVVSFFWYVLIYVSYLVSQGDRATGTLSVHSFLLLASHLTSHNLALTYSRCQLLIEIPIIMT